ncbi:hypothetical protein CC2G_014139 [Coprinopsis cinerea AmutBmut pab1-1]|nr:hypothetical protein CC2G_014139 [Coprinopsis cinerea AmutBmut pab1-1]
MQLPLRVRGWFKTFLSVSQAKLVYDRITLTRYTSFYFLFTVASCIVLSSLQGLILSDNTQAVNILTRVVDDAGLPPHLTRIVDGWLQQCDGIPQLDGTRCEPVVDLEEGSLALQRRKREIYSRLYGRQAVEVEDEESSESSEEDEVESVDDGESNVDGEESDDEEEGEEEDDNDDEAVTVGAPQLPATTPISGSTFTSGSQTLVVVTRTVSDTSILSTATLPATFPGEAATLSPSPTGPSQLPASPTVNLPAQTTLLPNPTLDSNTVATGVPLPDATQLPLESVSPNPTCIYALSHLEDGLHDSQREDVVILFSHLWMMTIGIVAILNESLPHLGAAFFAHILEGAWAASRIENTRTLTRLYRRVIVPGPCEGRDYLGTWWEQRLRHTIPIVVLNVFTILALGFFTWKLYKVYSVQTFSRVGASPAVHRMYRLLLFFSVGLQLASFFGVASAGMWISKMSHGNFRMFAQHWRTYLAVFVIYMAFVLPWVILGWQCMRKECRRRVAAFFFISFVLVVISCVMFSSALYRAIFMGWQFFATVTVTSFTLLVFTIALGILCRINFGKGLAGYLDVSEALEGADFTPVTFSRYDEKYAPATFNNRETDDWGTAFDASAKEIDFKNYNPAMLPNVAIPEKAYDYQVQVEMGSPQKDPFLSAQEVRIVKGASVYSDMNRPPIQLSVSPPIVSGITSASRRDSGVSVTTASPARRSSYAKQGGAFPDAARDTHFSDRSSFACVGPTSPLQPPIGGVRAPPEESRPVSVVSQLEHPRLRVTNPDAYRESMMTRTSVAPSVLPPVPIPTGTGVARGGSIRGMVAAFPVVSRRSSSEDRV